MGPGHHAANALTVALTDFLQKDPQDPSAPPHTAICGPAAARWLYLGRVGRQTWWATCLLAFVCYPVFCMWLFACLSNQMVPSPTHPICCRSLGAAAAGLPGAR